METFSASDVDKDSDTALLAATKNGDTHAFGKLVFRYQRRVLAVAQRITNNREDAEDVVQESFHKAYLHLDDFQEKSRFSTWLTRIVINEAFMSLRRRRGILEVLPKGSDDEVNSTATEFVDQKPSPEEFCWQQERTELLAAAINRLGPTIRKAILLRDIDEHSVEETAEILGTSVGAVKSRLFHARRKLRGMVDPELVWRGHVAGATEARSF